MVPYKTARERFSVKYYMVAVSFIVFDIEVVFLYPWAIRAKELGGAAFFAVMTFIIILLVELYLRVKKEASIQIRQCFIFMKVSLQLHSKP